MAGLLIKSNTWGGKLSSLRYQRVCVILAEKKKKKWDSWPGAPVMTR